MAKSDDYIEGERTVIKTNRGQTIVFKPYYRKKEPEGLWEDVYRALLYMGFFEN